MREGAKGLDLMLGALLSSPKILTKEPKKTIATLGACIAMTVLPESLVVGIMKKLKPNLM